ncbi:hypothetical protein D3C87_1084250 [compost metagenome]
MLLDRIEYHPNLPSQFFSAPLHWSLTAYPSCISSSIDPELSSTNIRLGLAPGTALYSGAWLGVVAASASPMGRSAAPHAAARLTKVRSVRAALAGAGTRNGRVAVMRFSLRLKVGR